MRLNNNHTFLLAALISGCFFLCSCENDAGTVKRLTSKTLGVEEGKDVVINYTLTGKTKAILKAPLMLRVQDTVSYVEFPKTLTANFYNEDGIAESRLTGMYGKYVEMRSTVFLKDSVKVINFLKGDTLYTDELYWDRNRKGSEFYTDRPVRIRTRTQVIDGIGMEARQDFRTYHIRHITGIIAVPASKFPG
jgi:LPS export ABC transporter protein LptC